MIRVCSGVGVGGATPWMREYGYAQFKFSTKGGGDVEPTG